MQEQPCIGIMVISIDMLDPLRVERALDWISVTHHLSLITHYLSLLSGRRLPTHDWRLQTGSSLITHHPSRITASASPITHHRFPTMDFGLTAPDSVLNPMNPTNSMNSTNPISSTHHPITLNPSATAATLSRSSKQENATSKRALSRKMIADAK